MRIIAGPGAYLVLFILGFLAPICGAFSDEAKLGKDSEQRMLAVLDPIDLHSQWADRDWGDFLRKSFAANTAWKVVSHDTMAAKFRDYRLDPRIPCHEFQCAFDAGNILSAEFVLFGSVTSLDDLYAFTLNLVHVPTSQTVWSRVGEIRKKQMGPPSAPLETALSRIGMELGPDQVRTGRREKSGQLTVLDLSASASTPARIMAERVATHLYASRNYDIMGRKEMDELLKALDINKSEFTPSDSSIYALGGKMDITHLVYSRLQSNRDGAMQLQLALYDIGAKRKMRESPSQPMRDFLKLLQFEDRFFMNTFKLPEYKGARAAYHASLQWSWAGVGAALAMGAAFGYLSYAASQDADREYRKFEAARSRESAEAAQSKVEDKERGALAYGVLGGVSLAGAGGLLFFSF
ncbi:MAG: hypothetical protein ABIY63_06690 [Fibrobacteria bacterium]